MVNINGLIQKAKQVVRDNPDKVRSGLDKVEQALDKGTGGKYHDKIAKGSDMLGGALGVPSQRHRPGPSSTMPKAEPPTMPTAPPPSGSPIPPSTPPTGSAG